MDFIKNKNFWLYIVSFMLFWHILDYLYNVFIAHKGYQFAISIDVILALTVALITGYLLFKDKK